MNSGKPPVSQEVMSSRSKYYVSPRYFFSSCRVSGIFDNLSGNEGSHVLDGISEFMCWYWFSKAVIGVFYPSLVLFLAKLSKYVFACWGVSFHSASFFFSPAPFGLLITANVSRSHSTFVPFGARLRDKVPAARSIMLFNFWGLSRWGSFCRHSCSGGGFFGGLLIVLPGGSEQLQTFVV